MGVCVECVEDGALHAEHDEHATQAPRPVHGSRMTTPPALIGLTAYAQSGKDAAAAALVEDGWTRHAFADVLREFAYAVNPLVRLPRAGILRRRRVVRLRDLVDERGWERAKLEVPEVRELLQRIGTDAGRVVLGENVWVDAALARVRPGERAVFTDCRFPNEANELRTLGGQVVRITRPGVAPVNGHKSETAMDDYVADAVIVNDGTLDELHDAIRDIATPLR